MDLAKKILVSDGVFYPKYLWAQYLMRLTKKQKRTLRNVTRYKPLSSKKEFKEIYIFVKVF